MKIFSSKPLELLIGLMAVTAGAASAQARSSIPATDKVLADRAARIYSIGAEDGESWELLSGVRAVAFDARDNLYVLDGNNYRILVFDANGRFLRQISKQGGGPGELMAPIGMTVTTDGFIAVGDLGRRAFSLFKTDGAFVKNIEFGDGAMPAIGPNNGIEAHPRHGVVAGSGLALSFGRGRSGPEQLEGGPTGERKAPVRWWDLGTSTPSTPATRDGVNVPAGAAKTAQLYAFTLPSITPKVTDSGGSGAERRVQVMVRVPTWQVQPYFGVMPSGGLAISYDKDYRLALISPSGTVERIIERPIKARKATEKDKKAAIDRQRENMKSGTGATMVRVGDGGRMSMGPGPRGELPSVEEMLRSATFEEFIPVIRRLETDPQGRIWVARMPTDFGQAGPIDIIRANGTYIGTLANDRTPDAVSRSGRAAWIERDDLGVEHVVVKRLPATWQ
ncbi:MAG: 6-bladed beta-propeller [Longimicrobiales bacterium]